MTEKNKPTYKLIVNPNKKISPEIRKAYEKEIEIYEEKIRAIEQRNFWKDGPRWDLIIEKGLEYYLKRG